MSSETERAGRNAAPLTYRTVKGWVVVNKGGHPFIDMARPTRRRAIKAYDWMFEEGSFAVDHREHGVHVVRCTITTEPTP